MAIIFDLVNENLVSHLAVIQLLAENAFSAL